jgi:hypothetical protein
MIAPSKAVMAAQQIPRFLLQIRLSCSLGTIYVPEWRDIDHCSGCDGIAPLLRGVGTTNKVSNRYAIPIKRKYIFVFQ